MHSPESEDRLVQQAVKGDRAAFVALYDKYVDQVYRHVYYRISNQADTEDITQEVFIKAWKGINKYQKTGAPFVAWLLVIARNLIAGHYHAKKKLVSVEEAAASSQPAKISPETAAEASLNQSEVRNAVLKLKGEKQRVIIMRFIDGFSYGEIARALNKSEGAVRVIQYRALNDLRQMLASRNGK
jgi:RNA polymerase sigma-70 factor (ECF subfamily)